MSTRALDAALPGAPRKRLVTMVRRRLSSFGVKPMRDQWLLTWKWARDIAMSYWRPMWPTGGEIAAQYMVLLLAEMRSHHALNLPYRAGKVFPAELQTLVSAGQLALPAPDPEPDPEGTAT